MDDKFIYDVESSKLYAPDGTFLKQLYCSKAKHWNQLIADDPYERSRGCEDCRDRVINLQTVDSRLSELSSHDCVYIPANSNRVIFINRDNEVAIPSSLKHNEEGLLVIRTVRNIKDINRAARLGYWPDVRQVEYLDNKNSTELSANESNDGNNRQEHLKQKFAVLQDMETGLISVLRDYRSINRKGRSALPENKSKSGVSVEKVNEVIPFTFYYPYYQAMPIAAYLIPPNLEDGSKVLINDPIEDLLGSTWNQGDSERAMNLIGYIKDRKVIIKHDLIRKQIYIG